MDLKRTASALVGLVALICVSGCGETLALVSCGAGPACEAPATCVEGVCTTPSEIETEVQTGDDSASGSEGQTGTESETATDNGDGVSDAGTNSGSEDDPAESDNENGDEPNTVEPEPEPAIPGPDISFVTPEPYEMVLDAVLVRVAVVDELGIEPGSVTYELVGYGSGALEPTGDGHWEGSVDTSSVESGLSFPMIRVAAVNTAGAVSEAVIRIGVDHRLAVTTSMNGVTAVAGEPTIIDCGLWRGGIEVTDRPMRLDASPAAEQVEFDGMSATVTWTRVGYYEVHCETADGLARDAEGIWVEVTAAAPASIETVPEATTARAGDRVYVACDVYDTWGNRVVAPLGVELVVSDGVEVTPMGGERFSTIATWVGTYDAYCQIGTVSDATPETVTLEAGFPAISYTTVSTTSAGPTESVTVGCSASDEFGNPVTGYTMHYTVFPADGASSLVYGVSQGETSFSATRTGPLYVACGVDGYDAEDESPPLVTVIAGKPMFWVVDLLEQDCYWQGRRLPLDVMAYDAWSNQIEEPDLVLTTSPAGAIEESSPGVWTLSSEGDIDITISLGGDYHPGAVIEPVAASVRVDSTPPVITFTSPERAAQLQMGANADAGVTITGSIVDSVSPLVSATVLGEPLGIAESSQDVEINVGQTSRWGMSVITATAEDECGNYSLIAQSYLRSGNYFSAETSSNSSARVGSGIRAQMNQDVIDDGNRSNLNDLASLGQAVLQNQDFNSLVSPGQELVSDPLTTDSCGWGDFDADTGYWVRRHSSASQTVQWSGPSLGYLRAINGGFEMSANMSNFSFPLQAWAGAAACAGFPWSLGLDTWEIDAVAGASSFDVTASLGVSLWGSQPSVNVQSLSINTNGLFLNADCGWADFLCDAITGTVIPWVSGLVEDALEDAVRDAIPPLLEDAIGGFGLESGFDIPAPINMTLNLASGFDQLSFQGPSGAGYGSLGLYTQVYPSSRGAGVPGDSRGSVKADSTAVSFSSSSYDFGLGLKDNLVNQVLWAVWYGGGLDIADLSSITGGEFEGVSLSMTALAPPVIMPGQGEHQIEIGLGDVFIDASVDLDGFGQLDVELYLSTIIGGAMDIDPTTNELILSLDSNPDVWVQVAAIDEPSFQGPMSELFTEILRLVVPQLLSSAIGSIPLPEFDVGGLAGLPQSEVWRLSNGSLDLNGSYYRLTGSLD